MAWECLLVMGKLRGFGPLFRFRELRLLLEIVMNMVETVNFSSPARPLET